MLVCSLQPFSEDNICLDESLGNPWLARESRDLSERWGVSNQLGRLRRCFPTVETPSAWTPSSTVSLTGAFLMYCDEYQLKLIVLGLKTPEFNQSKKPDFRLNTFQSSVYVDTTLNQLEGVFLIYWCLPLSGLVRVVLEGGLTRYSHQGEAMKYGCWKPIKLNFSLSHLHSTFLRLLYNARRCVSSLTRSRSTLCDRNTTISGIKMTDKSRSFHCNYFKDDQIKNWGVGYLR